ncbi:MAG: acetyl-CoA carboxylase biotin carboxyl carrier protein [Bacteroidetes bacterium HGW-Bacteroidetes-13]|nr:MAG: acetyl-CoA carboxylase biotin carboxyl carrier protein [Bacteroidetes bacterium HGW-Bacteroidetes-13]
MDLKEIQNLIKFVAKSGASEVKLEMDDFKITIRTGSTSEDYRPSESNVSYNIPQHTVSQQPQVVNTNPSAQPNESAPTKPAEPDSKHIIIKSPIIGTFYRRPSPDKSNFVDVGSHIQKGDVLCVIEAMKLFNEIESEISGTIVKILVDDSSPVEFDQPLFIVDPA